MAEIPPVVPVQPLVRQVVQQLVVQSPTTLHLVTSCISSTGLLTSSQFKLLRPLAHRCSRPLTSVKRHPVSAFLIVRFLDPPGTDTGSCQPDPHRFILALYTQLSIYAPGSVNNVARPAKYADPPMALCTMARYASSSLGVKGAIRLLTFPVGYIRIAYQLRRRPPPTISWSIGWLPAIASTISTGLASWAVHVAPAPFCEDCCPPSLYESRPDAPYV